MARWYNNSQPIGRSRSTAPDKTQRKPESEKRRTFTEADVAKLLEMLAEKVKADVRQELKEADKQRNQRMKGGY